MRSRRLELFDKESLRRRGVQNSEMVCAMLLCYGGLVRAAQWVAYSRAAQWVADELQKEMSC